MKKHYLLLISILSAFSLFADDYHSIQNFYGERATGIGGAFSAISDDTSGTYYNPAGISFIQESHYSINVSSYKVSKQEFLDLFGPGQNYTRQSRNYLPNFIGFVRKFHMFTFGLTMLNSINESFDQTNRILLPIYRRNLSQLEISYSRENFQIMAGPSISYLFNSKFSVGLTGYYLYDTNKVTSTQNENQYNSNITINSLERKQTLNFAGGIEFYITENIVIRLGRFTNNSNNREISWLEGAILAAAKNFNGSGNNPRINPLLSYELPFYREVHVNLQGYSFGIGFEISSTSISFSVSHQKGSGIGLVDPFQLPARAEISDTTFYLSGGSKY
jgi:hypothetical protein